MLAEEAAPYAGNGEDEPAIRNGFAQSFGDLVPGGADAVLVASGADVALLQVKARNRS